jgi:sec-independent protein translocase protein TatA
MLSPTHIVLLGLVILLALVVFGPKRLPELGNSVGRAIQEFKHATTSASQEFNSASAGLKHATEMAATREPVAVPPVPSNGVGAGDVQIPLEATVEHQV